jgi:hypothetical protein
VVLRNCTGLNKCRNHSSMIVQGCCGSYTGVQVRNLLRLASTSPLDDRDASIVVVSNGSVNLNETTSQYCSDLRSRTTTRCSSLVPGLIQRLYTRRASVIM